MNGENLLIKRAAKLPGFSLRKEAWAFLPWLLTAARAALPTVGRWLAGRGATAAASTAGRAAAGTAARALPSAGQAVSQAAGGVARTGWKPWLRDMAVQTAGMEGLSRGVGLLTGGGAQQAAEGAMNQAMPMMQHAMSSAPAMAPAAPTQLHPGRVIRASLNRERQIAFDEGIKWACLRKGCDKEDHSAVVQLLKSGTASNRMPLTPETYDSYLRNQSSFLGTPIEGFGNLLGAVGIENPSSGTVNRYMSNREAARKAMREANYSDSQIDKVERDWVRQSFTQDPQTYSRALAMIDREAKARPQVAGSMAAGAEESEPSLGDLQQEVEQLNMSEMRERLLEARRQREEAKKQRRYYDIARKQGPLAAQRAQAMDERKEMETAYGKLMVDDERRKAAPGSIERISWEQEREDMTRSLAENERMMKGETKSELGLAEDRKRNDAANAKRRAALMESAVETSVADIEAGRAPRVTINRALGGDPGLRADVAKAVLQRLQESKSPRLASAQEALGRWTAGSAVAAKPPVPAAAPPTPAASPAATAPSQPSAANQAAQAAKPPAVTPAPGPSQPSAPPSTQAPATSQPPAAPTNSSQGQGAVAQAAKLPSQSIARELTPEMLASEQQQMMAKFAPKNPGGSGITNLNQAQAIGQVASGKMVGNVGVVPPAQPAPAQMPAGKDVAQAGPPPSPAVTGVVPPPPAPKGGGGGGKVEDDRE